jgi:hypothetical protein
MLGLVEAPPPAPGGGGRRPGDHIDPAQRLLLEPLDEGSGQGRQGTPGIAVFQAGQRLAHRPLVGENGHPAVEGRRGGHPPGPPGPGETGGTQRGRRPPTAHAAGGEQRLEQSAEDLHGAEATEGV